MNTQETGKIGEEAAFAYLLQKGFEPVCKNYRTQRGEIDLIMRDGDILTFIEVKARYSLRFGYGREAVDSRKRKRILLAAEQYIDEEHLWDAAVRFDVIEVDLKNNSIEHIENAF